MYGVVAPSESPFADHLLMVCSKHDLVTVEFASSGARQTNTALSRSVWVIREILQQVGKCHR